MNENQGPIQQVPNELGVPDENTSNVVLSDPADTSSTATEAIEETPVEAPSTAADVEEETPAEAETQEEELHIPTVEHVKALTEAQQLPQDSELPDLTDEYGNFDVNKFMQYQRDRDQKILEHAMNVSTAREEAIQAENAAWDKVYEAYPEIKDHNLDNALRGARIQDITAGGDGDLARLAKDLAAPFRAAKIKAVEDANKAVEEAESLETFKPSNATPPQEAPSLMSQLQTAVRDGDSELASQLRHAIRKERIYGTDK